MLLKYDSQVSGTWRTDELFIKVKGNTKYLYALMDDQTPFGLLSKSQITRSPRTEGQCSKKGKKSRVKSPTS